MVRVDGIGWNVFFDVVFLCFVGWYVVDVGCFECECFEDYDRFVVIVVCVYVVYDFDVDVIFDLVWYCVFVIYDEVDYLV